jgi:uncharacterized membrane protein YciS (DUF1049 family)
LEHTTGINVGDILFQLFAFGFIIVTIIVIIFILRNKVNNKKDTNELKERLNRIEEKVDQLLSKKK